MNQAVEATLDVLGAGHGPNIRIEKELGDLAPVQGDPYTLQEVLFNLCTNALSAMPEGGTLTLRTYRLGRKDEDQMGSVAIDVSDTGVGIPRVNLERIFEPFFTTRADSGGTGLGLGLCRMLISEMGGRIEVRTAGPGNNVYRRATSGHVAARRHEPLTQDSPYRSATRGLSTANSLLAMMPDVVCRACSAVPAWPR